MLALLLHLVDVCSIGKSGVTVIPLWLSIRHDLASLCCAVLCTLHVSHQKRSDNLFVKPPSVAGTVVCPLL